MDPDRIIYNNPGGAFYRRRLLFSVGWPLPSSPLERKQALRAVMTDEIDENGILPGIISKGKNTAESTGAAHAKDDGGL